MPVDIGKRGTRMGGKKVIVTAALLCGSSSYLAATAVNAGASGRAHRSSKQHAATNHSLKHGYITPLKPEVHVNLVGPGSGLATPSLIEQNLVAQGGLGARLGVPAKLQEASSSSTISALASGKVDFALTNFPSVASAVAQGLKVKIVDVWGLYLPSEIVAKASIHSFKQLNGQTLATNALGDISQAQVVGYARAAKEGNPSSYHWVVTGSPENSIQYVGAGRAAAAWATVDSAIPFLAKFGKSMHVLVSARQMQKETKTMGAVLAVNDAYAAEHPQVVGHVVAAFVEASRRLARHEAVYAHIINRLNPHVFTPKEIGALYRLDKPTFAVNGGMVSSLFASSYHAWATAEDPSAAHNHYFHSGKQLADVSFVKKVVSELGVMRGTPDNASLLK